MSSPFCRRHRSTGADVLDALANVGLFILFALVVGSVGVVATVIATILQIAGVF